MIETEEMISFWDHIQELRSSLLKVCCVILCAVILCFIFSDSLLIFFQKPIASTMSKKSQFESLEYKRILNSLEIASEVRVPEGEVIYPLSSKGVEQIAKDTYILQSGAFLVFSKVVNTTPSLVLLGPLEGLCVALKLSFFMGLLLSSPFWGWVIIRFISPGLQKKENHLMKSFFILSLIFILTGCSFAFFVTIPVANTYLLAFNEGLGTNLWSLERYLDYSLFLIFANGVAFELGAIGIFFVQLRIVSAETLKVNRRYAIVAAFIIATLLTPPDVLTQLLLAIPLIIIYEGIIIYAQLLFRNVDVN